MTRHDPAGERATTPGAGAGTWRWRCLDGAGDPVEVETPGFDTQQAAEGWLAEAFEELADDGVATVTLLDGEREAYGPMPLAPDA